MESAFRLRKVQIRVLSNNIFVSSIDKFVFTPNISSKSNDPVNDEVDDEQGFITLAPNEVAMIDEAVDTLIVLIPFLPLPDIEIIGMSFLHISI